MDLSNFEDELLSEEIKITAVPQEGIKKVKKL